MAVTRLEGLGERPPRRLGETAMAPRNRTLLRGEIPDGVGGEAAETAKPVVSQAPPLSLDIRARMMYQYGAVL